LRIVCGEEIRRPVIGIVILGRVQRDDVEADEEEERRQ
jgi:hypothetical protein